MAAPAAAPSSADASGGSDQISAAATLELSTLQLQSQMMSTLLGGLSGGAAPLGRLLDVHV